MKYIKTSVVNAYTENNNLYYTIVFEGKEYKVKAFNCQAKSQTPKEIECIVEENDNEVRIKQSNRPILKEYYKIGNTETVTILSKTKDSNGTDYYVIEDTNGFVLRLYDFKGKDYYSRQKIQCKVLSFTENDLPILSPEDVYENQDDDCFTLDFIKKQIPYITSDQWNQIIQFARKEADKNELAERFCRQMDHEDREFAITCIELIKELSQWPSYPFTKRERVYILYQLSSFLLEDSNYMDTIAKEDTDEYRDILAENLRQSQLRLQAYEMSEKGEGREYVAKTLFKLERSGFLLNRKERITLLEKILKEDKPLFKEYIGRILQVAKYKGLNKESSDEDRLFLMEILDDYVELCVEDTQQNIAILSTQILILSQIPGFDIRLKRSRLFRFLSTISAKENDHLSRLAIDSIVSIGWGHPWYTSMDTEQGQHYLLLQKSITYNPALEFSSEEYIYERENVIKVTNGILDILPLAANYEGKLHQVIPDEILPFNRFRLHTTKQIAYPKKGTDLYRLKVWWKNLEQELFSPSKKKKNKASINLVPDINDIVNIEITGYKPDGSFRCLIRDRQYEGHGFIKMSEIVPFNVRGSYEMFLDKEGRPMQFKAKIIGNSNGEFEFTMKELIQHRIYENRNEFLESEDDEKCIVKSLKNGTCCTLSEYGYSVFAPQDMGCKVGDIVMIHITDIKSTGKIMGTITRISEDPNDRITSEMAAEQLIYSYDDQERFIPQQEEKMEEESNQYHALHISFIKEFICLLDSFCDNELSYDKQYNIASYALILSRSINDIKYINKFETQLNLIEFSNNFVNNESVDIKAFDKFMIEKKEYLDEQPMLNIKATQLRILTLLGKEGENELFALKDNSESSISNLAEQVLAYNLLKHYPLNDSLKEIKQSIIKIFSNQEKEKSYSFGREDLHTEFKTSAIFPANGMIKDVEKQMGVLCQVVCAFLNADGGVLYLGVNDTGTACGLESDLQEYGGQMDKLTNDIRIHIKNKLGADINGQLNDKIETYGRHEVYQIVVPSYHEPVLLDGVCYQRQGSSNIRLDDKSLTLLRTRKRLQNDRALANVTIEPRTETKTVEKEEAKNNNQNVSTLGPIYKNISRIETSIIRNNVCFNYEQNYIECDRFLNFWDNCKFNLTEYAMTDDNLKLELALHEEEMGDYLVSVFKGFMVSKTKVRIIAEKQTNRMFVRGNEGKEPLLFISIAKPEDALLTILEQNGKRYIRIDYLKNIEEEQDLKGRGNSLVDLDIDRVCFCEIVPKMIADQFEKINHYERTRAGMEIHTQYMKDITKRLKKNSIDIDNTWI